MAELIFNNKLLNSYHAFFDGAKSFNKPMRKYSQYSIDGVNGDVFDEGEHFENITLSFNCFIKDDFKNNFADMVDYLTSCVGYCRLENSTESDIYRKGVFYDAIEVETGAFNKYAQFQLLFNCKPQCYLKSGEEAIAVSSGDKITNPTNKKALPTIIVSGAGKFTVQGISGEFEILNSSAEYIEINSETMTISEGITNRANTVVLPNYVFPYLQSGEVEIKYEGLDSLEIIPNYWRL